MKICLARSFSWILLRLGVVITVLALSACTNSVALGETVELHEGDTVAIEGIGMRIRLEDVGHGWYADGRHFPIVFVTISYDGSTEEYQIEDDLEIGEYMIDVSGVFEPEGKCSLIVTKR